jgi:hypothetical protein
MPLIWGNRQYRRVAAEWRDGQIAHGAHAYFARRATSARYFGGTLTGNELQLPLRLG